MELSPDVYAWLLSTNILDFKDSFNVKDNNNVLIPKEIVMQFFDCKPVITLIDHIDELYSRFYKMTFNYRDRLSMISAGSAHSVRFKNWSIIVEVLSNYGLDIGEEKIFKISNNLEIDVLKELLEKMFALSEELQMRNKDNVKSKINADSGDQNSSMITHKAKSSEAVDILSIDEKQDLDNINNILEFFIVSVCQFLDLKPRQAAALLSDNRKYLLQIVCRGIKGDFTKILKWYQEMAISVRRINDCIKASKNREGSKKTALKVCSSGMFSKHPEIAKIAFNLVAELQSLLGTDWNWFMSEGIEGFLNVIFRFDELRVGVINLMIEMLRTRERGIDELMDLILNKDNKYIFTFFLSMVRKLKQVSFVVYDEMKFKLLDHALREKEMLMSAMTLIREALIHLRPVEENISRTLIGKLVGIIRENPSSFYKLYSFENLFIIAKFLTKEQDSTAITIFRKMISLFGDNFGNPEIKGMFLNKMLESFMTDPSLSINSFMDPYIKHLYKTTDYSIEDFSFINSMMFHQGMTESMLINVLKIMLNITLSYEKYFKIARFIATKILDREIMNTEIASYLSSYANNSLKLYAQKESLLYLIIPYDLMLRKIPNYIQQIEPAIVAQVNNCRQEKGNFPEPLLKFLWHMPIYDEILLRTEEKYAKKYKAQEFKVIEKPKLKSTEESKGIEKKVVRSSFDKNHAFNLIEEIAEVKMREALDKQQEEIRQAEAFRKKREKLEKKIEIDAIMLGKKEATAEMLILQENTIENNSTQFDMQKRKYPPLVDISLEEPREQKAIEILKRQYSKNLKYYHYQYVTNTDDTVTKSRMIKMFRDIGYKHSQISPEDLTHIIRELFGTKKLNFDFASFDSIIEQVSFLVGYRQNKSANFFNSYKTMLSRMNIPQASKVNKEIIEYFENLKDQDNYSIPKGFIKKKVIKFAEEYSVPEQIKEILGESKVIVIELLNEILMNSLKMPILESTVKEQSHYTLVPTLNKPKWKKDVIKNALTLDKKFNDVVLEVGQVMDEMLNAVEEQRFTLEKPKLIHPRKIEQARLQAEYLEEEKKATVKRNVLRKVNKEKLKKYKEEKEQAEEKKKKEQKEIERKIKEAREIEKKLNEERKERIKQHKEKMKQKEEEEIKKRTDIEKKNVEKTKKKEENMIKFFSKRKNDLKDLKPKFKRASFSDNNKSKSPVSKETKKTEIFEYFEKNKDYFQFEKELNDRILEMISKEGIKEEFERYALHNRFIYERYCMRAKDLSTLDVYLKYDQFNEFCLHFSISGILLTNDQIKFIFSKVFSVKEDSELGKTANFQEFLMALIYTVVFSQNNNKTLRIEPSHLDIINGEVMRSLFEFLNYTLPFDKDEMTDLYEKKKNVSVKDRILKMREFRLKSLSTNSERNSVNLVSPEGEKENWNAA